MNDRGPNRAGILRVVWRIRMRVCKKKIVEMMKTMADVDCGLGGWLDRWMAVWSVNDDDNQ